MVMTHHWITLVYLFNWLSDKPLITPYLKWEAYWMISVLVNLISVGGLFCVKVACSLHVCLVKFQLAVFPFLGPKIRLG